MKKLFSLMLAVWMAVCALPVGASAVDAADDGWSTYTGFIDKSASYTLKARGNEIEIQITSNYINGDELTCPGSVGEWWWALFRKGAWRSMYLEFEDGLVSEGGNQLRFDVAHACGTDGTPHTLSLKNDAAFSMKFVASIESLPFLGSMDYLKPCATTGYEGHWGSEECSALQLSVDGHTLTMTTTLPDQVVDYDGNTRELKLNSENLTVKGYHNYGMEGGRLEKIVDYFLLLFIRISAMFKKVFGI